MQVMINPIEKIEHFYGILAFPIFCSYNVLVL